jgi:arsenate reductase
MEVRGGCFAAGFALLTVAMLTGTQLAAQSVSTSHPQRVVFVCEHGSVKSLVAASYFNRSARQRGLPFEAVARGTAPEPTVPRVVQEGLHAVGMDVSAYVPKLFQSSDVSGASLVISFDQDIAGAVGKTAPHLKWDNLPSVLDNYSRGRDAIVQKVEALIDALSDGRTP